MTSLWSCSSVASSHCFLWVAYKADKHPGTGPQCPGMWSWDQQAPWQMGSTHRSHLGDGFLWPLADGMLILTPACHSGMQKYLLTQTLMQWRLHCVSTVTAILEDRHVGVLPLPLHFSSQRYALCAFASLLAVAVFMCSVLIL